MVNNWPKSDYLNNANTSNFFLRHPWDRYAFPGFVALIWFVILMGFVPDVIHKFRKQGFDYPLAVHVHAAVYVSWMVFLTGQTVLIGRGRAALHRRLGIFGAALAVLVVLTGLVATYVVENRMLGTPRADPAFISTLIVDVLNFATLAAAALILRSNAAAHKRLMLLATMSLLQAAFIRWWGGGNVRHLRKRVSRRVDGRLPRRISSLARYWGLRPHNPSPPTSGLCAWCVLDPHMGCSSPSGSTSRLGGRLHRSISWGTRFGTEAEPQWRVGISGVLWIGRKRRWLCFLI